MTPDYPPGEWSALLVGLQWVSGTTVEILDNALANRNAIVTHFADLYRTLQEAINTTLCKQEGVTADAIRDAFREGADQALEVVRKNQAYADALQKAVNAVVTLRGALTDIAARGNNEIHDIQNSKADLATKVTEITEAIAKYQREANEKAAACADDIMGAGEGVVTAQGGTGQSFRGMAHAAGLDGNQQPDLKAIEDHVRGQLNQPAPPGAAPAPPGGPAASMPQPTAPAAPPPAAPPAGGAAANMPQPTAPAAPPPAAPPAGGAAANMPQPTAPVPAAPAAFGGNVPTAAPGPPPLSTMPSAPMGGMATPAGFGAPTNAATGMAPPGLNSGAPMSAPTTGGAPGLPGGPVQAMASQVPPTAPTLPAATGSPVTVGDVPPPTQQAPVAPAPSPVAYTSEPASPMMTGAAPLAAVPPPSAGPLPAYGADLRPPTVAAPPTPPVVASAPSAPSAPISQPPSSAVPGSAPVHPSAGGTPGAGQPAVVRQSALSTPAPQSPPGVGAQGVLATAGGALAGAVSADSAARTRLQRLVSSVAAQQPRLAWAVGDRADETTVLVTDLASGWIPPGIEIPAAVTLLEPARRRGDLEALLGEVNLAAASEPGHYHPESDTDEPVPTSRRRRRAPEVEELSWQLSDATHWRDGLPRLAHTLARAASRGTGVLESEAEQLHDELTKLADRVLDSYPDNVDAADVGNWQLLAAIEALVSGDKAAANYHLAWFLACNTAAVESVTP